MGHAHLQHGSIRFHDISLCAEGREDLRHFSPVVLPIRDYKMAQNEWFTYQDQRKGHPIWFTPSLVSSNTLLHGFT